MRNTVFILFLLLFVNKSFSQCGDLFDNQSFEGVVQPHIPPLDWSTCYTFTPDCLGGGNIAPVWGIISLPTDGSSYLGLVSSNWSSWQEAVSQKFKNPLIAGRTYKYTIDLLNSFSHQGGIDPAGVCLRLWGGYNICDTLELLWQSDSVPGYDFWKRDTISFVSSQPYTWGTFQVHPVYENPGDYYKQPYLCIDNMVTLYPGYMNYWLEIDTIDCPYGDNGAITIHASGENPPFSYIWSNGVTDSINKNLNEGVYGFTIEDNDGCMVSNNSIALNTPQPIVLTYDMSNPDKFLFGNGVIKVNANGGTNPYTYVWNDSTKNNIITNLKSGTYTVTVSDKNNCTETLSVNIPDISKTEIFLPNCISPNGDGMNDLFMIYGNTGSVENIRVSIFNRWGEKLFESEDIGFTFDGTYKGQVLNSQVLVYVINIKFWLQEYEEVTGSLTILR